MWQFDFFVLISASVANLTIGLLSYLKNYQNLTHKLFALLSISLVGLTTANYVSISSTDSNTVFAAVKMILLFVVLQNTFYFLFVSAYPGNTLHLNKTTSRYYLIFSALVLTVGIYPGFFESYTLTVQSINPKPSPLMGLFIAHTLISALGGLYMLWRRYKTKHNLSRVQFKFLVLASSVLLIVTPLTNFVLPVVLGINFFIPFAPIYMLIFASLIAYSMVKHKLLDIRAAVARSLAYVLSLAFIGLVYGSFIFAVSTVSSIDQSAEYLQRGVYIGFALLTAVLFQPMVSYFARITNRIFFQDAYEPQIFLDELNDVLVVNIELEKLLTETIRVIEQNLKANFCVFSIRETSHFPRRIIGDATQRFEHEDIEEIGKASAHLHEKVIVADIIEESDDELKKTLEKNDIAILVRLVATLDYEVQGVGYMLFGTKKSGNPYNKQDIQVLEIIANELVIAIQNGLRFEEIEKFNATLQEKIDVATRKLQKTNEKLEALDETKDEFISMASHQLRTPLTSVKGYLSMVLEGDAGEVNEMQNKLLNQAFVSSQRMVYLIADLLNVSRLRTGKFLIEVVATNLADVVEGEVGQLTQTAKARGLTLSYSKPENFPSLMLDETKIRQVMMNFMDNAIYYAKPEGHVTVALKATSKTIEYTVTDDGIGVPKSEQHHLFTKFYRAGNAKKARPDGTGLGLFMAKKVIVAQGGAIIFRSEEGKGSTFGFSFEKAKLQPKEEGKKE